MIKRIVLIVVCVILFVALYLFAWPVELAPVAWDAPEAPELTGVYAVNNALAAAERLLEGIASGPEDVAIDSEGRIYGGMIDGRIVRADADGGNDEVFADTGGRPLGLHFDEHGNLIVADAVKGLLSVSPDGEISVLSTEAEGLPFGFADDLDIARDGTIYFSDASHKFGIENVTDDIIEHGGNGRLIAYDPQSKTSRVLLDGLNFANGVAVSPDQKFLLLNETGSYRVLRYWLEGPDAGTSEVFIENLPGFPDGISSNGEGTFWLALYSPRLPIIDSLDQRPFLRKMIVRLPAFMQPAPIMYGFVLGLNGEGEVIHNLQDPAGGFAPVTSIEQSGDMLYLGSLTDSAVGRIAAP